MDCYVFSTYFTGLKKVLGETEFETLTLKLTIWAPPYFPIWGKVENFELINEMKN